MLPPRTLPRFHTHKALFICTKSSAARLPVQTRFLFTHGTLTCCKDPATATLTISESNWVREILFLFFFPACAFRQLLWWWDTKTVLAANVHMSGKSTEVVFVCVWMTPLCVSWIISWIMPWRGSWDDLPIIRWAWCVFYCLLNRRLIKGFYFIFLSKGLNELLIFSTPGYLSLSATYTANFTFMQKNTKRLFSETTRATGKSVLILKSNKKDDRV